MSSFFQPSAWFTLRPAAIGGLSGNIIFAVLVLLFVLGIVSRIVAGNKVDDRYMRTLGERVGTMLMTMGGLGLLFFFFSYERIQLFGAPFWYLFWAVGLIVWIVFLARFAKKTIPQMRSSEVERIEKRKYLPKRNRKK